MKESMWLQKYEAEVGGKRKASNQNKKIILIIVPIMALVFIVPAILGGASTPEQKSGIIAMVAVFAAILLFAVIMMAKGKKKDVTKPTRENVQALFETDAEVEMFDQQMSMAPIGEIKINSTDNIFMTQDYVGLKSIAMGDLVYMFAKRDKIASIRTSRTGSTTANPMNASFFFDVVDKENKIVLRGLADTGKQLEAVKEMLGFA